MKIEIKKEMKMKNENDQTLMSSKDENKDENENMLLEYMEDVDDKPFKEYSKGKTFNSFINEFDRATNKEDKEKIVKELKDINNLVKQDPEMEGDYSEYKCNLFDIVNVIYYFLDEYSKQRASGFNWREALKDYYYYYYYYYYFC